MTFTTGMTCPNCGAQLDSDSIFCMECGTPVAAAAVPTMPLSSSGATCSVCGTLLDNDAFFCTGCGAPVSPSASTGNRGGLICTVCGEPLDADASFCVKCGTRVSAAGVAPASDSIAAPPLIPATSDIAAPTEPPRIFDGNDDDPEAEREMKRHFHSAEGFSE